MTNNTIIKKFINGLINEGRPFKASYKMEKNEYIKIRLEYDYNKKTNENKNIFIYINDFNGLINLYDIFPDEHKHFYEVIEDYCKFFLDLDVKMDEIEISKWFTNILLIKNELKLFFKKYFDSNINILEFRSSPSLNEPKYSCHLVMADYCFKSDDCKIICSMFLNELKDKGLYDITKLIDDKVYGKNRMLRIEGSTKINSTRKKICIYDNINDEPLDNINFNGLITNLENTTLLKINENDILKYNNNKYNKFENSKNNNNYVINNKYTLSKENNKKYNYNDDDILYLKYNIDKIINAVNSWYYENLNTNKEDDIFKVLRIEDNRIDLKRINPYNCPICKRIHDNQNPYIFISNKNILFNCRRCNCPIKIHN